MYGEPSLNFYLNRRIQDFSKLTQVADWSRLTKPGVLVIPRDDWRRASADFGARPLREIHQASGFNYSKGKWCVLVVLERE